MLVFLTVCQCESVGLALAPATSSNSVFLVAVTRPIVWSNEIVLLHELKQDVSGCVWCALNRLNLPELLLSTLPISIDIALKCLIKDVEEYLHKHGTASKVG